jgi:protease-4
MNYSLISQVLGGTWFLDRSFAESSGLLVKQIIEGNTSITSQGQDPFLSIVSASSPSKARTIKYSKWEGFEAAKSGSVAIVKIHDVLMKQDQSCGPIGMETMGNAIKEADSNENIIGTVCDFDTPGGSVLGLEVLGEIIKNTNKPIIGFVNGQACSAGMWLASCCDEIIASTKHDNVGCIGTMSQLVNMQPAYEKMGVQFRTLYSNNSKDKNKLYHDAFKNKEGEEAYKAEFLDPLASRFQEEIRNNRMNVSDDLLTGKTYFAKDVVGSLIDRVGTIDDAIAAASGQTGETEETTNNNNSNTPENSSQDKPTIVNMNQFDAVNAVLAVDALESIDGTVALNGQQLEALNTALAAGNKAQTDLTSEQTAHGETKTQLTQSNEQVENLKGAPGAKSNDLSKGTDSPEGNEGMEFLAKEDVEQFNLV